MPGLKLGRKQVDPEAERALQSIVSSSPYPPEPPRESWVVNRLMQAVGHRSQVSPHSCGGDDVDKVQYEWDGESQGGFWTIVAEYASIEMLDGKDVLDVGCGWGGKAVYYATKTGLKSIVGMDIPGVFKPEVAQEFADRVGATNASFITGFAEEIPVPDESFDVVIMEDVLEHVRDPEGVLAECMRVLRPGGKCIARFPSIKMMYAHHFDRALSLPGLHYVMSWRTWSAGFNHYLATHQKDVHYVPFAKVVTKRYHPAIGMDLSGLTLRSFRELADESGFDVLTLALVSFDPSPTTLLRKIIVPVYRALRRLPILNERLSFTIVFVGQKPRGTSRTTTSPS